MYVIHICIQIISYHLVNVLTLTIIPGQRLSATVDNGQMVTLDCSTIFYGRVFPLYLYSWRGTGIYTKFSLSPMARYVVTADSDSSYTCFAIAMNLKGRDVAEFGNIDITVRGIYSSWCSIAEQPFIKYLESNLINQSLIIA